MGCWNATCMVSGLPIIDGDPIVTFVIIEQRKNSWGSSCYCYGEAGLLSPPIHGEYDDYGGIKNIKMNKELEHTYKFLNENLIPAPGYDLGNDTDNEFHCFEKHDTLEEMLQGTLERGYANIVDKYRMKSGVNITHIKKEVWDHMMTYSDTIMDYRGVSCREFYEKKYQKYTKQLQSLNDLPDDIKIEQARYIHPMNQWDGWHSFPTMLLSKETMIEIMTMNFFLESTRINIRPTTQKGSQTTEMDMHRDLAKLTLTIVDKYHESLDI